MNENEFLNRRNFLKFLGSYGLISLSGCASSKLFDKDLSFKPIKPHSEDQLILAPGLNYSILIREGELLNKKGLQFGACNDFLAFLPTQKSDEFILWANHEGVYPKLTFKNPSQVRTKFEADREMKFVGGSAIKIKKINESYQFIFDDELNQRWDGHSKIEILSERAIEKSRFAHGTLANCSGGRTPWGTILTCEENFVNFVGERKKGQRSVRPPQDRLFFSWQTFYPMPPEHYGWVVEINPFKKTARKLTSLGRMSHEGATVTAAKDGRVVVYMGDDNNDHCLYKFISNSATSLEKGTLYVANLERKEWLSMSRRDQPLLQRKFKDQTEVLIYAHDAALLIGGSQLDRPEDIEIDPKTNDVFISLTNNLPKGRPYGSILKLSEENADPGSLRFVSSQYILGGEESGIACPDNMCRDKNGNLWITSDVAGANLNKPPYQNFGNNSLYFLPLRGPHAGKAMRVASAPIDAEFTGPCFSPDGNTLFLSVQHPGETTVDINNPTSRWPYGGSHMPASAVVAINGPTMTYLLSEA